MADFLHCSQLHDTAVDYLRKLGNPNITSRLQMHTTREREIKNEIIRDREEEKNTIKKKKNK